MTTNPRQLTRHILRVGIAVGFVVLTALVMTQFAFAQFTEQINYQGKLNDSAGVPVTDGTYNMVFRLYTQASGGSPIWTEGQDVTLTNGLFSHMLGSSSTISGVDFNQTLYLAVEVEGDGEMSPRKILGSVPSAFEANNAQTFAGIATTSFLRSDQADTTTALLAFSAGFTSSASSSITELTTGTTTVTTFVIDGETYTNLGGNGLQNNGGTLAVDDSYFNTRYATTTQFDTEAELESLLTDVTNVFTNNDTIDISDNTNLTVTATGLELSGDAVALAAGYSIPLTASTSEWATAYGWGDHSAEGYLTTVDISDDTNLAVGNGITLTDDTLTVTAAGGLAQAAGGLTTTGVLEDLNTLGANTGNNEFLVSTAAGTLAWESGATARTSLGVDAAGTDNSTNVTLAGAYDYLALSGQQITLNQIDLGTDVTGVLGIANGGIGVAYTDPNADRILFWDDSAGTFANLAASTGLTLSGTNLTVRTASETQTGISERATQTETNTGTDDARHITPLKLNTWPGSTNLTTLGTVTTGTWNATALSDAFVSDTLTIGAGGSVAVAAIATGTNGYVLQTVGGVSTWVATSSLGFVDTNTQLTEEEVEDYVGGMLGGTQSGITVTYQDSTNDIDFVVDDVTAAMLASADFGDFTCNGTTCSFDANTVGSSEIATNAVSDDEINYTTVTLNDFTNDAGYLTTVDISDNTNLVAGTNITLSGDTLNVDDAFVLNTGDSISGNLTFSGSVANIALGSNYLSGDGADEGIFVDGSGNVGIGNNSPNTTLHVEGNTSSSSVAVFGANISADEWTGITFGRDEQPKAGIAFLNRGLGNYRGDLYFLNNNNNDSSSPDLNDARMVILSAGNVGIGTTTPSQALTVAGNAYITGALYDNSNSAGTNGMVLQTTGGGFAWVATTSLGFSDTDTTLTEEEVEDYVGGMLGGTQSGITVTYQDSTNDIDFVVDDVTAAMLASADFGDFTCNGTTCSFDANTVGSSEIATNAVSDDEINYTTVTLNDFTNDAGFITDGNTNWDNSYNLFDIDTDDTDDITEGTTNLFSQWSETGSDIYYNSGSVGIGSSTPSEMLAISSGTAGDAGIILEADTDNSNENDNPYIKMVQDGGLVNSILGLNGNADLAPDGGTLTGALANSTILNASYTGASALQFGTSDTVRMTILNTGNVGIGDTSPASLFTVGNGDLFQVNSSGDIITQSVGVDALASEDFGDFTCNGTTCSFDANTVGSSEIATNAVSDDEINYTNVTLADFTNDAGYLVSGDIDTSSEIAAIAGDETGSGSLVFSASPTFTGTVIGADARLSGGLTVGGAGSDLYLAHSQSITPANGTSKTYGYISQENTGENLAFLMHGDDGTDRMSFMTDYGDTGTYTENMTIVAATGYVGINNTTPSAELDVQGDLIVGTTSAPLIKTDIANTRIGINADPAANNLLYVENTSNNEGIFFYQQANTLTGQKDAFTIQDNDSGGGSQDESSSFKVLRSGSIHDSDDGTSLVELTYSNANNDQDDEHFYILGRLADEGAVEWGVDLYDADIWTTGGLKAGATGVDCAGTDAGCFNSPSFEVTSAGVIATGSYAATEIVDAYITDTLTIGASGSVDEAALTAGTNGYVLQTVGGVSTWVATTSLGISNPFGADINVTELASEDFGSFTCNGATCTIDSGAVSNAMLTNSSVNFGGVSVSLGGSDTTPAFNLIDATGLPVTSGIAGFGTNIATFLATPSSANLAAALTNETGTGNAVFSASPTFTGTPILPSTITLGSNSFIRSGAHNLTLTTTGTTNVTLPTSGTLYGTAASSITSANLASSLSNETGTGNVVFSASPTFTGTINAAAATLSSTLTLSGSAANIALGSNWLSGDGQDEGIFVSSTGQVGIGDPTPGTDLSILPTASGEGFEIMESDNGNVAFGMYSYAGGGTFAAFADGNAEFFIDPTWKAYFTGGNFGIGTSTPARLLTVAGDMSLTGALYDGSNSAGTSGMVLLSTGSATSWVATSSLGISSPFAQNAGSGTPYDVSTASYTDNFSVATQETGPQGMAFNDDGTKVYVVGNGDDEVNEYALSVAYDVSTASYVDTLDVSTEESDPRGMAFNDDGTKLYIVGYGGNEVNEYALSVAYDVSTASHTDIFSLAVNRPYDMALSSDGTKMYILAASPPAIHEYTLSVSWDISTATTTDSFSVSSQETLPNGMAFNDDGTKVYVTGQSGQDINEYTLSVAWDVSTATYADNFSVSSQETVPSGMAFNDDGTKVYVVGDTGNDINEYSIPFVPDNIYATDTNAYLGIGTSNPIALLDVYGSAILSGNNRYLNFGNSTSSIGYGLRDSGGTLQFKSSGGDWTELGYSVFSETAGSGTPYDVSTATYTDNFSVSAQETTPRDLTFNNDGTKVYVIGNAGVDINEYALSVAYDVSTATYTDNFSVSAQDTVPLGMAFNNDGTKVYVIGGGNDAVYEYALSVAYDVSTATYTDSFDVSGEDIYPNDVAFSSDGTKLYIVGDTADEINEYALSVAWDVSTATHTDSFSVSAQEATPVGMAFNNDGTKVYVVGNFGDDINEYALSVAWDVSTATHTDSFSVSAQETEPQGMSFNNDGSKVYVIGFSGDDINEYSIPFTPDNIYATDVHAYFGLGTSDPNYMLEVAGTSGFGNTLSLVGSAANIALGSNYLSGDGDDEGIYVDGSGNVAIGTSTPNAELQVIGDIRVGTTGTNGCVERFDGTSIAGTCSSDERLKTNILTLAEQQEVPILERFMALEPVTYNWNELAHELYAKGQNTTAVGLIAQNVEFNFPELVIENSEGYKQVDFTALTFYMMQALREVWQVVTGNQERITELEARVIQLEQQLSNPNAPVQSSQSAGDSSNITPSQEPTEAEEDTTPTTPPATSTASTTVATTTDQYTNNTASSTAVTTVDTTEQTGVTSTTTEEQTTPNSSTEDTTPVGGTEPVDAVAETTDPEPEPDPVVPATTTETASST